MVCTWWRGRWYVSEEEGGGRERREGGRNKGGREMLCNSWGGRSCAGEVEGGREGGKGVGIWICWYYNHKGHITF